MWWWTRALTLLVLLVTALASFGACTSSLGVGAFGTFRYAGQVKGTPPLRMVPSISDRSGNIYSLYGAPEVPEAQATVSRFTGGSTSACSLTKGDTYGVHGWVGFAESGAWYWSGDALVAVEESGQCVAVLDRDPGTNANVFFRAVIPWVRDRPSGHSTVVALVQSPTDPSPFAALVDLTVGVATNVAEFTPTDATDVHVLGVGSDSGSAGGFVLVDYAQGGARKMEGRFYDAEAKLVATAPVEGSGIEQYGVHGYLQMGPGGRVVGLAGKATLVSFDRGGGGLSTVDASIAAVGVHRWDGALWLVGTSAGRPVVASIDADGHAGTATPWAASEKAASAFGGPLSLTDDRTLPARATTWSQAANALGEFPFVHPHSPWPQAPGTSLFLVAGPPIGSSGALRSPFAVAPVGLTYP